METNDRELFLVNDVTPAVPVHPGGILGEELKARGISQKKFAEQTGLQATHLSALIHGARNFTPSVAAKIESGLEGISAGLWMRLQEQYNKDMRRRSVDTSKLVSGYTPLHYEVQPAFLAEPKPRMAALCRLSFRFRNQIKPCLRIWLNGWAGCAACSRCTKNNGPAENRRAVLPISIRRITSFRR